MVSLPMRVWIRVAIVAAVVVGVVVVALRPTAVQEFNAFGRPRALPAAGELTAASGSQFEGMLVGLEGIPVIVNVWASWCAPCRSEAPLLARAARESGSVVVVGVAAKDELGAATRFMDEFDMDYVNVFDSSGEIMSRLDVRGFPTTYVFDATGTLVKTVRGGITDRALAAAIEDIT